MKQACLKVHIDPCMYMATNVRSYHMITSKGVLTDFLSQSLSISPIGSHYLSRGR